MVPADDSTAWVSRTAVAVTGQKSVHRMALVADTEGKGDRVVALVEYWRKFEGFALQDFAPVMPCWVLGRQQGQELQTGPRLPVVLSSMAQFACWLAPVFLAPASQLVWRTGFGSSRGLVVRLLALESEAEQAAAAAAAAAAPG